MSTIHIGVINVSDRAAAGVYDDVPGKAVVATLREYLTTSFEPVYRVIADEQPCRYPQPPELPLAEQSPVPAVEEQHRHLAAGLLRQRGRLPR